MSAVAAYKALLCSLFGHHVKLPMDRSPVRMGLMQRMPAMYCDRCGKRLESVDELAPPEVER